MASDQQLVAKKSWHKGFWFYVLVMGVLYQGVPYSLFMLLGSYYVLPWYLQKPLRDFEYEPQWIFKKFLWQALFFGIVVGIFTWIRKELKEEQEEKKRKAEGQQGSATSLSKETQ